MSLDLSYFETSILSRNTLTLMLKTIQIMDLLVPRQLQLQLTQQCTHLMHLVLLNQLAII